MPLVASMSRARDTRRSAAPARLPSWIAVPLALDAAYGPRSRGPFLRDVVWAQFCLFQCIRLQDDVFDRHTTDLALVFASDQYLVEAERTFARHFPRSSRFWEIFRSSVETTTRAIVQVDAWQRRLGVDPARLAREYAKVAAVLEVGAIAVCLAHRRGGAVADVRRFLDSAAIGDQILDDFEDLAEDLRRSRFNYVAQRLHDGGRPHAERRRAERQIAAALQRRDGVARILSDAERRFARAAAAARRLAIPALGEMAGAAQRSVRDMQARVHRAEVARVLGPLLRVSSPGAPRRP